MVEIPEKMLKNSFIVCTIKQDRYTGTRIYGYWLDVEEESFFDTCLFGDDWQGACPKFLI